MGNMGNGKFSIEIVLLGNLNVSGMLATILTNVKLAQKDFP
jgi:hypothetical protein